MYAKQSIFNNHTRASLVLSLAIIALISLFASVAASEPKEKVKVYFTIDPEDVDTSLANAVKKGLSKTDEGQSKGISPLFYNNGRKIRTSKNVYEAAKDDTVKYILEIQPQIVGRGSLRIDFTLKENGKKSFSRQKDCNKNSLEADIEDILGSIRSVVLDEPHKVVFIYCFNGSKNENENITALRNRIQSFLPTRLNDELKYRHLNKEYVAYTEPVDCSDLESMEGKSDEAHLKKFELKRTYLKQYEYFIEGTIIHDENDSLKLKVTIDVFNNGIGQKILNTSRKQTADDDFIRELAKFILDEWHQITGNEVKL